MALPLFVLMGSEDYYYLIAANIRQLHRVYPGAEVLVFAWGPKPFPYTELPNVTVIDWREKVENTAHLLALYTPAQVRDLSIAFNQRTPRGIGQRLRKTFIKRFPNSWLAKHMAHKALVYENMLMQKVLCLRETSRLYPDKAFLFLDADAFVYEKIDELFTPEHDVVVSIVEPEKMRWGQNDCNVLILGVLFFGSNLRAREAFFEAWWDATQNATEFCKEQTALVRLIAQQTYTIFQENVSETLTFNRIPVRVWVVPASLYNRHELYNLAEWPDEKIPYAKIYHFTNMAQDRARMHASLKRLELVRMRSEAVRSMDETTAR